MAAIDVIVVDCAAVVDSLTGVSGAEQLRSYLASEELHAPTLLDYEVISALRGLDFAGQVSAARIDDFLADFDDLPIRRWPSGDSLRRRTFQLRNSVSAYDAAYIALAEALKCPLVTRDARLARSHGHDVTIRIL